MPQGLSGLWELPWLVPGFLSHPHSSVWECPVRPGSDGDQARGKPLARTVQAAYILSSHFPFIHGRPLAPMSDDPLRPAQYYRFDGFEFRERTGELRRDGQAIRLPDQAGKVLLALLRVPGELVTREQLREFLWPDKVSGDFEGGLHAAVRKLRRALDDDGSEPRLIGTLPRRGYRLLVPVAQEEDKPGPEGEMLRSPVTGLGADRPLPGTQKKRWPWTAAGGAALLLSAGLLAWRPWSARARVLALPGGVRFEMVYLPPGEFLMGYDVGFRPSEPVHRVTLTHGYWLGRTEVTQAQWRAVMGHNPSFFQGDDKPVEQVSWDDCQAFLTRLNQLVPNLVCRLPTEAEWEYAARTSSLSSWFDPRADIAWNPTNSLGQTHPVAQKTPNPWGLYDMVGNVWEWCADGFGPFLPYPQKDPQGPVSDLRTIKGGSCLSPGMVKDVPSKINRLTVRYGWPPDYAFKDLGFRIVAVPRT